MRILTLLALLSLSMCVFAAGDNPFKIASTQAVERVDAKTIGNMQLVKKHQQSDDKVSRVTFDSEYPYLTILSPEKPVQRFNDLISDIIDTETGQFRAMVDEIHTDDTPESLEQLPNHGYSDIKIRYDIVLLTAGNRPIISILFTIDSYVAGAAHPNSTHRTLNYDFSTGDGIAIADLFKPKPDFIPVLNKYSAQSLTKLTGKSEKQLVADNEINYAQWNLTSKGLLVTFDELPHVYGLQQVLIPFEALNKVLQSNSIIQRVRL
jgi:hypothetical protein